MERNPQNVAEAADRVRRGQRTEFLFFWGHQPERDGRVGQGCLSQWWPAPFVLDCRTFATAEHYMMWRKALLFGDEATAGQILAAGHPQQAKEFGRGVPGFDQGRWEERREEIVLTGSIAKFGQHPELRRFLLNTGQRVLVEASPVDPVWGIGLAADDPAVEDPARWRGLNLLGFALMRAREALTEPV
ncbi:NADAR family protein [Amycolatopsis benzoatilytica]|uniref:NADAR family protein n=1 Tax=Amycolatopsis benzoatilytica TaxID=346045 RepID=UPI000373C63E|nr:NADAR family protein [Amycolatopsis benzoatilytica]